MPALKYSFRALPNVCKCCGTHAGNPHDPNCLINVPVKKMPSWRLGYRQRCGGLVTAAGGKSYQMGAQMAAKKLLANHTPKSLQQAAAHAEAVQSQGNY